jgi:hypothetical protein
MWRGFIVTRSLLIFNFGISKVINKIVSQLIGSGVSLQSRIRKVPIYYNVLKRATATKKAPTITTALIRARNPEATHTAMFIYSGFVFL